MCGLGQGSKAAPASWIQLSLMIVQAYKRQGLALVVADPITGEKIESVGCMFVNDTNLYCMHPVLLSVALVVLQAQACMSLWSELLSATGGAIKGPKSFWYLVDYKCVHGKWEYGSFDDNKFTLYLPEVPNQ